MSPLTLSTKSWTEGPGRCEAAGIPQDDRGFATKPTLATSLIDRAEAADVPAAWVAGDEVYGADPRLRAAIRGHCLGYVLAIAANRRVPTHAGPIRVDALPALIPKRLQRHSAAAGAHCPPILLGLVRLLAECATDTGMHHVMIRRTDTTGTGLPMLLLTAGGAAAHPGGPWLGNAGASKNPTKPPRASSASISTRFGAGNAGTAGLPWPCSLTPS